MNNQINTYNNALEGMNKTICEALNHEISSTLLEAESKVWHGHPVWFLKGNPVVGYSKIKGGISLLFWSGQSFDELGLTAKGNFKAAEALYTDIDQVNTVDIKRWLKKSINIQWDYKNIVKRQGVLERLV